MPAFPEYAYHAMQNAIDKAADKVLSTITLSLTIDEYLELFVPPHLREIVVQAPLIAELNFRSDDVWATWHDLRFKEEFGEDVKAVPVAFRLTGGKRAPLVLEKSELQPDISDELANKITAYVIHRGTFGREFGRAKAVLAYLQAHCSSPAQVRFLWPSVLTLCTSLSKSPNNRMEESDRFAALLEKMETGSPGKSIPSLPGEVRAACRSSAGAIATAELLEDPCKETGAVVANFHSGSMSTLSYTSSTLGRVECK